MKNTSLKSWQGITCVIGLDWGDSGKGRLIDDLSSRADIVARYSGGSNTGHTVKNKYGKFAMHIMPSGIFNQKAQCLIGRGVACDLESLIEDEMAQLQKAAISWKNLIIDEQASLTMPWHKLRDGLREEFRLKKIGTTKRGVGPTYADRIERVGLRIKDLMSSDFKDKLFEEVKIQNKFFNLKLNPTQIYRRYLKFSKLLKPYVGQTIPIVKNAQNMGKNILFEGTQGSLLDVDFGTYPFVTSTNIGVIGIWRSFNLHPSEINHVIGISKAYSTRVGAGPQPTKLDGEKRQIIIEKGQEIGTTSGRTRDPGWLDLVIIRAAAEFNKLTALAITKLDVLTGFKKIKVCTSYKINDKTVEYLSGDAQFLAKCQPVYKEVDGWREDLSKIRQFKKLPKNAQNYIKIIEKLVDVSVKFISVGPNRGEVIYL